MIAIIDYGMGNVGSILNMLRKIGVPGTISSDAAELRKADGLILPGVGAFDHGMAKLERLGLVPVLAELVQERKTPILGICLGMQLMTKSSEEGKSAGLGWLDARTVRFRESPAMSMRIPHMGWNTVVPGKDSPLIRELGEEPRFYFVHSYYVQCASPDDVLLVTTYGHEFTSAAQHGNICCVQFHPEKSHKYGMKLLKNFAEAGAC